jgi:hypothetical protein
MKLTMKFHSRSLCIAACLGLLACRKGHAQSPPPANYDETNVVAYTLPDPLRCEDGTLVTHAYVWREKRRPELMRLFEEQVYGRTPAVTRELQFEATSLDTNALNGRATRKEVTIRFNGTANRPCLNLLIYLPNDATKPVPAFLGLNFKGNHTIHADPGIRLPEVSFQREKDGTLVTNRVDPATRGESAQRWPVETIVTRGYALVTAWYADLEPDFPGGWKLGVRAALSADGAETVFQPDDWGAIGAWAWGLSRAMDYLEREQEVDAKRVALLGHSRLGKTALWAGAQDERFAIVISNNSGEGGAALARRNFGETTERITRVFPHWFCGNLRGYAGREDELPVDQHELLALMAPRPVYVASAEEDRWADPRGEFLAAKNADPVYRLLGKPGLDADEMPAVHQPVGDFIGYHIRSGKHDVTDYDWEQYLRFADRHLRP